MHDHTKQVLRSLHSPHLILVPRTFAFMRRHVTSLVFPVHNCFASPSKYVFCSHYNRASLVDRSTVTPYIPSAIHRSRPTLLFYIHFSQLSTRRSIHDVSFVSLLYTLLSFQSSPPPNYPVPFLTILSARSLGVCLKCFLWERYPHDSQARLFHMSSSIVIMTMIHPRF
ncbi:hypothetical protein BDM02DRAFT_1466436 [Thelephora ganbajun]|uniref:Uncharacterized protein n=1 Tax=Thelephora ganbajun TaxID=370292 RepID=A0ACB6Z152_THEGA|nr:hypothetical protein BDM02DRAFT_1466436 [Thelephora ganbajun]